LVALNPKFANQILRQLNLIYLQHATLKKFENEAELLFSKNNFNNKQIRTLEKLRDTQFPKLRAVK
jgi:hypothetical protein